MTTIGFRPTFSALRDHELGLRQRAFGGVHQHQRAVHHVEDALDLTAEIGVARRIDDVDAGVLPLHRCRLGENGDAALALEIVGIHGALDHALIVAIGAGLLQQAIDQGGLAVVDVGDDGDVAKVHSSASGSDNGKSAISRENRDQLSGSRSKTWNTGVLFPESANRCGLTYANFGNKVALAGPVTRPKRKPGQKDRAHHTRCGAI